MKYLIFFIFFTCSRILYAGGDFEVTASGDYDFPIDDSSLIMPVGGSDINSSFESADDAVSLDITDEEYPYTVEIRKDDTSWPSGVTLQVRRTGNGAPAGDFVGGTNYQTVTGTDTYFFHNTSDAGWFLHTIYGIPLQYRIQGISLANIEPGTYTTTITFTVTDTQ